MKTKIIFAAILLTITLPLAAHAEQILEFTYNEKTTQINKTKCGSVQKGGKNLPGKENKESRHIVHIGTGRFSVSTEDYTKIYDFKKLHMITLNKQEKTFSVNSLYSIPAFKSSEKKNRERLSKVIAAANIDCADDPFDVEMLFGMADKNTPTSGNIVQKKSGGFYRFIYKGEEAAAFEQKGFAIPKKYKSSFEKYILYEQSLHPLIRKNLLDKRIAPKTLQYQNKDLVITKKIYKLVDTKLSNGEYFSIPQNYQQKFNHNKDLNIILSRSADKSKMPKPEDYQKTIKEFLSRKNHLDAFLTVNEYGWHYGITPDVVDFFKLVIGNAPENSDIRKLLGALRAKSKEEFEAAIKLMESISATKPDKNYVLDVMIGNNYVSIGQTGKGRKHMLRALAGNPFMASALKDLGDMFYREWYIADAWVCWDKARTINPDLPLLARVNKYEASLRERYPEYFGNDIPE